MTQLRPPIVLLLTLAALLALFAQGEPSYAATITVNTTADELNSDGDCSLREAIQAANTDAAVDVCTAGSGADTIDLPAGTYTLGIAAQGEDANTTGDLDITADLTVNGAGAATTIVDGNALDRVFDIPPRGAIGGATVTISGLIIQNGSLASSAGGGIRNTGTLTLNSSTVSGNTAGFGGGIYNRGDGTLELNTSTVSANTATTNGGGIYNEDRGTLTLNGSTVSGNTAGSGRGGGIFNDNRGTLTLNGSTVSGNTATSGGAGIYDGFGSTLTLISSTVSANTAGDVGGGILNNGVANLKNTIVANNSTDDCAGSITSAGHNLDSDGTCSLTGAGDISTTGPLLGPLADNGGPTQTHALLISSRAIDAGSGDCPPPATDQRGVARPQGAACDIGAYELVPAATPTPTLTPTPTPTTTPTPTPTPGLPTLQGERGTAVLTEVIKIDKEKAVSGFVTFTIPQPDTNYTATIVSTDVLCRGQMVTDKTTVGFRAICGGNFRDVTIDWVVVR